MKKLFKFKSWVRGLILAGALIWPAHSVDTVTESITVSPRIITPNGDGINDLAFFYVLNPTGAQAEGNIYDLKSAKIAVMKENTAISKPDKTVLDWDGKDESGAVVPGGVYLYKISVGDKTLTGTVGVAK